MERNVNRRSIMNPVVDRQARLRMLMPFLVLVGAVAMLAFSLHSVIMAIAASFGQTLLSQGPEVTAHFNQLVDQVEWVIAVELTLIAAVALVLWAFYSLRIFGPQVAIHRHIQALINHDYDARIKLRRFDEFAELARQLNHLAEVLKEREGGGPRGRESA